MTSSWSGAGKHPDIPGGLMHFVGRPRGPGGQLPPNVPVEPRDRMAKIMHENALRAAPVFGTTGPALCFSEVSASAAKVLFETGVTGRGPYAPWALVFGKTGLLANGARPVWYMSDEELHATANLPAHLRDRRVRFIPGKVDWLAEREWRICWGDGPVTANQFPGINLSGLVIAVIVGELGWHPPPIPVAVAPGAPPALRFAVAFEGMYRFVWTGNEISYDQTFDIRGQAASYGCNI